MNFNFQCFVHVFIRGHGGGGIQGGIGPGKSRKTENVVLGNKKDDI